MQDQYGGGFSHKNLSPGEHHHLIHAFVNSADTLPKLFHNLPVARKKSDFNHETIFFEVDHLFYFSVPSMEFLTIEYDAFSDIRHGREKVFQQHVNDNDNHEG